MQFLINYQTMNLYLNNVYNVCIQCTCNNETMNISFHLSLHVHFTGMYFGIFYILYPYKWWYYFLFCDRNKKLDWSDKVFTVRLLPIPNSLALRVGEICSIKDSLCAQWNEEFECLHRQLINAGTQKKLSWTSYMYNFKLILAIFH